jgi:hypothetical protein
VTISGTNLLGATSVRFGTKSATVTVDTPTSITATSPAESVGTVDVTVATSNGISATSPSDQFAYTSVITTCTGTISSDSELASGDYTNCSLDVPTGFTLAIDPGAVVKFGLGAQITVEGTLDAVGTATDPVVFTSINDDSIGGATGSGSPAAGDWGGITTPYFIVAGNPVDPGSVDLKYAQVSYSSGGISANPYGFNTGSVSITDTSFDNTMGCSVWLNENSLSSVPVIEDNSVTNAVGLGYGFGPNCGYYIRGDRLNLDEVSGNAASGGAVFAVDGDVASSTWNPGPLGLVIANSLDIPEGTTLTVAPGTVVKAGGSDITVEGTLDAVGTATDPVVFTSINDDSIGGATGSGSPAAGDWGGIELGTGQASSEFSYAVFEYASAAIQVALLDVLPVTYSVFSHNIAAITVQTTADDDPVLGALDCVPPYLSVIDASTDWFGSTGYPAPSIDLLGLLGGVIPSDFSSLYGAVSSYGSAEVGLGDNTIPWSVYTCPALFDFPIPVTAVIFNAVPSYPLSNAAYEE